MMWEDQRTDDVSLELCRYFFDHSAKKEDADRMLIPKVIQQADAGESEEQRIAYVRIIRAKDNLYISVPTLSRERRKAFEDKKLPIQIVDLQNIMVRIKHES